MIKPLKKITALLSLFLLCSYSMQSYASESAIDPEKVKPLMTPKNTAHQFSFKSIDGEDMPLSAYAEKVVLIVNTASQCGFTKQYADLQALHEKYNEQGLVVIGVPCNQFGKQEPGSEDTIKSFVKDQYGITFPLTSKVAVKGKEAHPFFSWAAKQKKGKLFQSSPKWNFHKYLLDQHGRLIKSFGTHVNPQDKTITSEIEALLKNKQQ